MMDMQLVKQCFLSPLGFFLGVLIKSFLAGFFLCLGAHLTGYKSFPIKMKYIFSIFFVILGIRLVLFSIFSEYG